MGGNLCKSAEGLYGAGKVEGRMNKGHGDGGRTGIPGQSLPLRDVLYPPQR